jgi:N-acetylmuramoyl-L-alanine amidase
MLVLHYTGMRSPAAALARLCDPKAAVSAHYVIDEAGRVVQLVPEAERAWHAGVSWWQGRDGLNDVSIGIELVNPGHEWGYQAFPEAQMASLVDLARAISARWSIPAGRVVAHSDIAPERKSDPGELFDWKRLAHVGIGLWPQEVEETLPDVAGAQAALTTIGYPLEPQGVRFEAALIAFQRRFRPCLTDGQLDPATMGCLLATARLPWRVPRVT